MDPLPLLRDLVSINSINPSCSRLVILPHFFPFPPTRLPFHCDTQATSRVVLVIRVRGHRSPPNR